MISSLKFLISKNKKKTNLYFVICVTHKRKTKLASIEESGYTSTYVYDFKELTATLLCESNSKTIDLLLHDNFLTRGKRARIASREMANERQLLLE